MARVKRGTVSHRRRESILKKTKGFRWGRKAKVRLAKDALRHAWEYSFRDRKAKKRTFRQDWQRTVSGALGGQGITYGRLINGLKKHKIELNRKILAQLAKENPEAFRKIVEQARAET